MRSLIVDDEPPAGELLGDYVLQNPYLSLVAYEQNPIKALEKISTGKLSVDIIFLDFEMPGLHGAEFARTVKFDPVIVFTTAHRGFGPEAFEVNAADYLVKPISYPVFAKSVEKIVQRLTNSPGAVEEKLPYFFINRNGKYDLVKIYKEDVLWIEGNAAYITIKTKGQDYLCTDKLKQMERLLPPPGFIRIHRSYIVNLSMVEEVKADEVILSNKKSLPVGDMYRDTLFSILSRYRPGR